MIDNDLLESLLEDALAGRCGDIDEDDGFSSGCGDCRIGDPCEDHLGDQALGDKYVLLVGDLKTGLTGTQRTNLWERMDQAAKTLHRASLDAPSSSERIRLTGKAQGMELALSYLEETRR